MKSDNSDNSNRLAFATGLAPNSGVFLRQSYPIEVVAGVAAACSGASHRERVIDALRLLEAAEDMAVPQHPASQGAMERDDAIDSRIDDALSLLSGAFPPGVEINRVKLCVLACAHAGRGWKDAKGLTDATEDAEAGEDHAEALYREWADAAAGERELRALFYEVADAATRDLSGLRMELAGANNVRERRAIEKAIAALPVTPDAIAKAVSERQRKAPDRAAFLATLEGRGVADKRAKVLHDEDRALLMLVGENGVEGFLPWLRRTKGQPTPPKRRAPRDDEGRFAEQARDDEGRFAT
jgi:hypothetical protein